jgi:4-oxalocrotonate tautomerase
VPLVRITVPRGTSAERKQELADGVHDALVTQAGVPADDRFQVVDEAGGDALFWSPTYLGFQRSGALVWIEITLNAGRSVEVKKALYARIAANLAATGVRPDDILVSVVEVARENWSFGGGVMSYPPAE